MALEQNSNLGDGGTGFQGKGAGSAALMIKELQGLNIAAVAGAGANTDIAVAGILLADTVQSVYDATGHAVLTDFTVTSDGNIQSPTITTGANLLVFWFKKPV